MIGGAGFSADGNKGASTKQQGHFTLLQLKISGSSIAELFKVLSGISGGWCGGAIPLMVAIIISAVVG